MHPEILMHREKWTVPASVENNLIPLSLWIPSIYSVYLKKKFARKRRPMDDHGKRFIIRNSWRYVCSSLEKRVTRGESSVEDGTVTFILLH
jgi:hypothetical protein